MDFSPIKEIAEKYGAELLFNERLSSYTSFRIGGECKTLLKANCEAAICEALKACEKAQIPCFILGKGSNVLAEKYDGLIILMGAEFSGVETNGNKLRCLAGTPLKAVCRAAADASLTGLEFACGIPGTMGGALYMNAGAYGGEMSGVVRSCTCCDRAGNMLTLSRGEMELGYRASVFEKKDYVILSVDIELESGDGAAINARMNELLEKRRKSQPLEYPSAGSTFKRPAGDYAARLIEASGLKGFSAGAACVSEKHSGFVINKGGASFDDVMNVIDGVKKKVYADSGIMLECEVRILR